MQQRIPNLAEAKHLLVEGRDEELFFDAFIRHLGVGGVQVWNYAGKDNLGNRLGVLVDTEGFDRIVSIGIVRDADTSASSAFQSVQGSLRNAGLSVPIEMLVASEGTPKIAVFVMPDNSAGGALEDLCLATLEGDPAMPCVNDFLQCVGGRVETPPQNVAKARMHAFLASREDSELRLGEAAQRGYLPWGNAAFEPLTEFLTNL